MSTIDTPYSTLHSVLKDRAWCCVKSFALVCLIFLNVLSGPAQAYPTKVVRLVVPFSAGSGSDTIGRIIAQGLTQAIGQQVFVDNRSGAAGNIGTGNSLAGAGRWLYLVADQRGPGR